MNTKQTNRVTQKQLQFLYLKVSPPPPPPYWIRAANYGTSFLQRFYWIRDCVFKVTVVEMFSDPP